MRAEREDVQAQIEAPPQSRRAEMDTPALEDTGEQRRGRFVVRATQAEGDTGKRRLGPGLDGLQRREPTMRELRQDQFLLERRAIALEPVELEARPQP